MASLVNPVPDRLAHDGAVSTRTKLVSHILIAGLGAFPLYVSESGRPQISNMVLPGFMILSFLCVRQSLQSIRAAYFLSLLCGVIALRQILEGFLHGTFGLMPVAYIVFNSLLVLAVCNFRAQDDASSLRVLRK